MKRLVSFIKRAPKLFSMLVLLATAMIVVPLHSAAAAEVIMEGSMGVANQTRGETNYKEKTNASYDEVVKFQVFYHNRELPDSGRVAENFKIKINMPTQAGTNQVVKVTMGGDNTNTITDSASVVLNRSDAHLEFIPGSTHWRHNVGTRTNIKDVTQSIPDSVILNGSVIENVQPCHEFEATVTFMARVRVPSVGVTKAVRAKGAATPGTTQMSAKPGDRLEYMLTGKNLGNQNLTNLTLRDALPKQLTFVPGTVKLYNGANPKGVVISNDFLLHGGVNAGSVGPGASVFITFEADVKAVDQLACGMNDLKNIVVVKTDQTGEYNNSANVSVKKECVSNPDYSCDLLAVSQGDNRSVKITDFKTTAKNGATFKHAVVDWGDSSTKLTSNNLIGQAHTYGQDGTYTITATAYFTVNGQEKSATSQACAKTVTFKNNVPVTPTTPTTLPNTGAGDIAGIFAAVSVAGTVAHKLFLGRRFAR
jgi:uncharacterized repeat protein (TIGR01451 family)